MTVEESERPEDGDPRPGDAHFSDLGTGLSKEFGDQIEDRVRQTRLAALFLQTPSFMAVTEGPEHVFVNANPTYYDLVGDRALIGRPARQVFPDVDEDFFQRLDRVYETGEPYVGSEEAVRLRSGDGEEARTLHVSYSYHPLSAGDGSVAGILHHGIDVTERVESRRRLKGRLEQQTAVAQLGRSVLGTRSLPDVLQRVVETAADALDANAAELFRHQPDGDRLVLEAKSGADSTGGAESPLAVRRDHVAGRAFADDRPVLIRATDGGSSDPMTGSPAAELALAVPIPGSGERPLGVLALRAEGDDALTDDDVPAAQATAQVAGAAIEREEYERFTETVASNLPGVLYRCRNDPDWTMEYLSDGTEALTGYPAAELTGAEPPVYGDLIHPDDRGRVWREVQAAVEQRRPFHLRYRIRTRDGESKWIWEQGRGVQPETRDPFVLEGYIFDITGWRKAEAEVRRLESVLRAAFRGASDAIFVVELPGRTVEECNAAAEELFGYSREEMVGESTAMLHEDGKRHRQFGEESERALRETGNFRGEFRMQRKDGTVFPTEHSVTYADTGSDEPDRAVSIVRDLTSRHRREAELERSRRLLQRYAAHVTKAREEERAEVAREVHDELGQTLTALKLQLEGVRDRAGEDEELAAELEDSLELLSSTLGQVRDLSTSLRPTALDSLGLREALEQLTRRFQRDTDIRTDFQADDLRAEVDSGGRIHVYRVVQEALTNVARHADADAARVELSEGDEGWTVRVVDDGVGLPDGEPDGPEGHGLLGMRERARLLGGELTVRTRDEGGAEVRLQVPQSEGDDE